MSGITNINNIGIQMIYSNKFLELIEKIVVAIGWIIIVLMIVVMLG